MATRDNRISFDEDRHIYYVDGEMYPISVSGMVHLLFPSFNADKVITKMRRSRNWRNSKYYGMRSTDIKQLWEDNRIRASDDGTIMHKHIEDYYNGKSNLKTKGKEYDQIRTFIKDHSHLRILKTEWRVFDDIIKFAGTIDAVFENNSGIYIYDWKRSKEIKKENQYETGMYELSHLPHSNFWHYSIQLNLYRYILNKFYNKDVKSMYLVQFHPDIDEYKKYRVPNLNKEINIVLKHYIKNYLLKTK